MNIFVDIDDVLIDTCKKWVNWLNEHYNTNVKYEDIKQWDLTKAFPGLSEDQIYGPLYKEDFWKTVEPIEGAVLGLAELMAENKVYLLSASHWANVTFKIKHCIKKYFPYVKANRMIFCWNKSLIYGDVLIDDNPENLIQCNCKHKIIFDQPHNNDWDEYLACSNCFRCNSWEKVVECVKSLKEYCDEPLK